MLILFVRQYWLLYQGVFSKHFIKLLNVKLPGPDKFHMQTVSISYII